MIIGLLGRMSSGKDTVAQELVNTYGFRQDSYASTLKDMTALLFNWDRAMLAGETAQSRVTREQVDPWWAEKPKNSKLYSPSSTSVDRHRCISQ